MVGSLLLVSAMSFSANAVSGPDTTKGASLVRGCQAEVRLMALNSLENAAQIDLINGAYCLGYLNGFIANLPSTPASICTHADTVGALVRTYVDYMERNPPLLEADKRVGLRMALEDAYPCPAPR